MKIGDWQWLDFENVPGVLDWTAFVLGALGIGFAIYQLTRSRNALTAARDALVSTRKSLVKNQLVAVLPRLEEIDHALDDALVADDREGAGSALVRYRYFTAEVSALLGGGLHSSRDHYAPLLRSSRS
ncbi:hypothetical protein ACFFGH_10805 [Lysobacter korlensis]|uniref:Uncharacterized protein n=1 Tax=Lysobacter korlensis TaxID=553636 RepID=A0ABV6RMW7_9GAMM